MKRIYLIITLLCVLSCNAFAQLSGTVTINQTLPATATNYQSFTGLANALNTQGLNGPLLVNVVTNTGPYIEQPVFKQMGGISAFNTITIQGNKNVLTSSGTGAQPWTLLLDGADYMFVNNLQVAATGTTYGLACVLCNGAQFNTFSSCTFSCNANVTSSNQIPVSIRQSSVGAPNSNTGFSGSNNLFRSSTMYSGYQGVYIDAAANLAPDSKNTFSNCRITDWSLHGLYATNHQSLTVKNCVFDRPTRTVFSALAYGMYFMTIPGGLVIDSNCISNIFPATYTNTVYGLYISDVISGTSPAMIKNNFVNNLGGAGTSYGLNLQKFYGTCNSNTILINNAANANNFSGYGLYFNPSFSDSAKFQYNSISMTQGSLTTQYGFYITAPGKFLVNNNKYYVTSAPTSFIGYHTSTAQTFSAWQGTGVDAQGTNYTSAPAFTPYCGSPTVTITVAVPDNKTEPAMTNLFPNPVATQLSIDFNGNGSHHVTLRDLSGREVFSIETMESRLKHPMTDLPAGIYFLEIRSETGFEVKKFIKE